MPNVTPTAPEQGNWFVPALLIVLGITAWRVLLLALNRTDLFVDEAQYWLWGQELAMGYYSKPPLIGWVIRASTEIGGSDAPFWVRLPGPLFHAATAIILGAIAAPRFGARAAIWTVATYITLPMIVVGSLLISTDTIMVPFLMLGFLAWLHGLDKGGSVAMGALAGACVGLAFMAKYAAVYFIICAVLAALFLRRARPGWPQALTALLCFAIAISPNIIWNLQNGLSTVEHTLDNADWVRDPGERAHLGLGGLAAFIGSQLGVFGLILFPALVGLAVKWRRQGEDLRLMLLFSLPILGIVCIQALLSEAYPNWAATAYLAGTVAVVAALLRQNVVWLKVSLAFHLLFAVLMPLATVLGTEWRLGSDQNYLLERYVGRSEMSDAILETAKAEGMTTIVAANRDVLADLFYRGADSDIAIYARPTSGRAPNHYVLKHALPAEFVGEVLLATKRDTPGSRCASRQVGHIAPTLGAYAHLSQTLFVVDAACLAPSR